LKVADNMHEEESGMLSYVTREAKNLVNNYTQVMDWSVWKECVGLYRVKIEGNRRDRKFLEFLSKAYNMNSVLESSGIGDLRSSRNRFC